MTSGEEPVIVKTLELYDDKKGYNIAAQILSDRNTFSGIREKKELIPEAAFREVIANALFHRAWNIPAHVNVSMYSDRIEVTLPGGLPKGISKEEYLRGGISIPRKKRKRPYKWALFV